MAVGEKTGIDRQTTTDFREGLVIARCDDTIRLFEQHSFQVRSAAADPLGDLEARGELGIGVVKGMSEQARQERSAASALQELGRAHQQTKHEVPQRWGGSI